MLNKSLAAVGLFMCAISFSGKQFESAQPKPYHHHLMPVPESVQFQSGRLAVDASFSVAVSGPTDARIEAGVYRAVRRLEGRTGFELARTLASDSKTASLVIECKELG